MDSGNADILLKSGSVLTGAVIQRGPGRVNSLSLDGSSTWNVRNDSSLGTLNNAGTVAFTSPGAGGAFKTLTVNNYVGGGTLVLNTWLGDDASPTDRLVIDGGTASGTTSLRIVNAGGAGGQTQQGIRVVDTINGGTTGADAFRLDSGSTGYRSSSSTLALNGYDYSLVRGGNGGVAPDWYLTSDYTPPVVPPVTLPVTPPSTPPVAPPEPPITPPEVPAAAGGARIQQNVSPESGAYVGNQRASTRLFSHSLHDRAAAYPDAADATSDGRRLWARAEGRHDGGMSMRDGKVDIDTDSGILQLGGDLLRAPVGQGGAAYAGLMGGYGEVRTRSTSTLMLPGSGSKAPARARGKVSGYSVGVTPPCTKERRGDPPGRLRGHLAAIRPLFQPDQQRVGLDPLSLQRLVGFAGVGLRVDAFPGGFRPGPGGGGTQCAARVQPLRRQRRDAARHSHAQRQRRRLDLASGGARVSGGEARGRRAGGAPLPRNQLAA